MKRDSRALIFQAARAEFAERGFHGARVARIAARAGVNKQLVFYYFGSKSGLHEAVTADAASRLRVATDARGPATEAVRRTIDAILSELRSRPELVASLVEPGHGRDRGAGKTALGALEGELASVISSGQGLGYFRDDADPRLIAREGVVLCVGFVALFDRFRNPEPEVWAAEVGETLVRRLAW